MAFRGETREAIAKEIKKENSWCRNRVGRFAPLPDWEINALIQSALDYAKEQPLDEYEQAFIAALKNREIHPSRTSLEILVSKGWINQQLADELLEPPR